MITKTCARCRNLFYTNDLYKNVCDNCLRTQTQAYKPVVLSQYPKPVILSQYPDFKSFAKPIPTIKPVINNQPETYAKPLPETKPAVIRQELPENKVLENKPKAIRRRKQNPKNIFIGLRLTYQEIEPIANTNMSATIRKALKHYIEKHLNKQPNGNQEQSDNSQQGIK